MPLPDGDDITYYKRVPNTTPHGQIVQYPENIVTQQNPGHKFFKVYS